MRTLHLIITLDSQLSILNRSRTPDARTTTINSQSFASSRRSHYNYQLSTVN
ncbi:MAG: hypothetical protein ACRC62_26415 [Microcoleus sp.]